MRKSAIISLLTLVLSNYSCKMKDEKVTPNPDEETISLPDPGNQGSVDPTTCQGTVNPEYNYPNSLVICSIGYCGKTTLSCQLREGGKEKLLKLNTEKKPTIFNVSIKCEYTSPGYEGEVGLVLTAGNEATSKPILCKRESGFVSYQVEGSGDLKLTAFGLEKLVTFIGTLVVEVGSITEN